MRELINLTRSVLLIPLIEIFFTIIVCDNESYFKSKFSCWEITHFIYVGISLISFLFMMYLSHIFISISFSKKDKMEQFISKAFIKNANLQFLYIRAITIILLEFLCIKDILMIVVLFMFLSSMYVTYCYQLENKYQKDNNLMTQIFYYLNLIYFWDSICLFIGKLVSKTDFKGMLEIFFIGIGLVVILIFTLPKKRMRSVNEVIENDIDVYNQIRLMINAIEDRAFNREHLFDIFAYLSEKLQSHNLEGDELILKKKIESFKNSHHINDKEFEYYLFQQVDLLFRDSINIFRESVILKVTYAIFQIEKLGRYNKGYINLSNVSTNKNLPFAQDFLVYRLKRRLEDKGIEDGIDKSNLSFRYQCNQLISMISKISMIYSYFWNLLLTSTDFDDIIKLSEYGIEINEMMEKIDEKFKALQNVNYINKGTIKLYGMYIRDILNEQERAFSYLSIEENENFQNKSFDLNTLVPNAEFQFMLVSGKEENFGIITKISLGLCHLLGYSDQELIGQNLNYLLPDCIHKTHEEMLKKKIVFSKIGESNQNSFKKHFALLKMSSKCLLPINLEVGIVLDEDYNPVIFTKINYDDEQFSFFSPGVYFLLTNHKLIIESFTSNCLDHLGLNNQVINGNNEITLFIKELNEEILSKLINSKSNDKLKTKLKILRQKINKETNITWKNNKKYKMLIEEILINNNSLGFMFRIENCGLRDSTIFSSTQRISIIGAIGGIKRNSITSIKEIEKRKDFPQIGKNYVPSNFDEINFDINDKVFLFQDKTLKGEKIENIGDYFNEKYFPPIEEKKDNEKDNNDESNEESEDNESYESESFEESSNIEYENKKKKIRKSLLDDIENNNEDIYYKVKTSNIKLSVYNYNQKTTVEINDFPKESKVEQILKGEKEKSKSINVSNNNSKKNISFEVGTNSNKNEIEKKTIFYERNNEKILKMISPKIFNTSVIFYIFLNGFTLISILIISILFFLNIYSSRTNILKLHIHINYLILIYRNLLNTNFYAVEMILILNEKYVNLYQDKDEYYDMCKNVILSLYERSIKEIEYFCYSEVKISSKTKNALVNYNVNIKNYQTTSVGLKYTSLYMKLTDALCEYDYALLDYGNSNKSSLNPQNNDLFFIVFNVDNLILGVEYYFELYYSEINNQIDNEELLLYTYLGVFIVLEIIAIFIGAKASIYLILEKENYLRYFYKIDDETIRNILIRCEKFIKLNRESPINMISEPEINLESENESLSSEVSSLLETEEIKKIDLKKKKKHMNTKKKEMVNYGELKFNIILTVIFYGIELIFGVYITIFVVFRINQVVYYEVAQYLTIKYERLPLVILNNLRMYLLFYPVILEDEDLISKQNDFKNDIINAYFNISKTYISLFGNVTENGLPKLIKNKYFYIEINSLCGYFSDFLTNYSIECDNFSSNITKQGLALLYSYSMNSVYYLFNAIEEKISYTIRNNLSYNELYYGTSNYSIVGNIEDNPFLLFNDEIFKNLTISIIYIINPVISDLIQTVSEECETLFSKIKKNIIIVNVLFFIVLFFYYLCYILPFIIKKNMDLNKTRKMLGIIPKDIFVDILNNEKKIEKDKKI